VQESDSGHRKKEVTVRKASELYGLSYGYLYRRLSGEVELDSRNGPQPIFNKTEEEAMAHWLTDGKSRHGVKAGRFFGLCSEISHQ
jgi:hypothetical protein